MRSPHYSNKAALRAGSGGLIGGIPGSYSPKSQDFCDLAHLNARLQPPYLNKPSLFDMLSKKTGGTLWIQKKNYLHGLTAYFQGYTDPKTTLIYVELASRTVQYEYERVADLKASEVQRLYCPPMLRIAS